MNLIKTHSSDKYKNDKKIHINKKKHKNKGFYDILNIEADINF